MGSTALSLTSFELLHKAENGSERLKVIHQTIKKDFPFLARISVALYDEKTGLLKAFIHSSDAEDNPLEHYQFPLHDMPSLLALIETGRPRLINDLNCFRGSDKVHVRKLLSAGIRSSYTVPMLSHERINGFVFFNSTQMDSFDLDRLETFDLYGYLVGQMVMGEMSQVRTLATSLKVASGLVHRRPDRSRNQPDRIANYARLIARRLAETGRYDLSDEYIENLFDYARLYDMGKLGVSGQVLRKPGRLDYDERREVEKHPLKSRELLDGLLDEISQFSQLRVELLRHVTEHHHETMDGHGYPDRLKGEEIALEARIVAVADIFDALTSWRPYHQPWSNELAFAMLRLLSTSKLDSDCVNALISEEGGILEIQERFRDQPHSSFNDAAQKG
ncbi:MAG: phosphohydrolase [Desulfuromonas sp.]|nr:MAG: phosphohydrolase [Desulfuromonas sp.]